VDKSTIDCWEAAINRLSVAKHLSGYLVEDYLYGDLFVKGETMNETEALLERLFQTVVELMRHQFTSTQVTMLCKLADKFKAATENLARKINHVDGCKWQSGLCTCNLKENT
jgi:hypothetical protein